MFAADNASVCPECEQPWLREQGETLEQQRKEESAQQQQRKKEIAERAAKMLLTTTPTIEGHRIVAYLGIESVEIVIGTGFLSELSGDISDFLGQRSKRFEGKLEEAKRVAFDRLKTRAAEQGANAVVGIDLDYTEFSGNRIGLIVNGTLVRAAPIAKTDR
jgi:uncharacterized protein YbjQ (UPF0145 family)